MLDFSGCTIESLSAHLVGNKANEEPLILSEHPLDIKDERLRELLLQFFLTPFEGNQFFSFDFSNGDLSLNPVYSFAKKVFENRDNFHQDSIDFAKHLYEQTNHPKIKSGDFYVAYFDGLVLGDEVTDAIGLFKAENKQSFLKLLNDSADFRLQHEDGIATDRLDKGSLIFNVDAGEGYKVCIVDKSNRAFEAQYWRDDFLHVKPCADDYYYTEHFIKMTKDFVVKGMDEDFKVDKADKIDFLNKSVAYFKANDKLVEEDFAENVFQNASIATAFQQYTKEYKEENQLPAEDSFSINAASVKRNTRGLRSVLKLDKNFHIYIHGDRDMIERGFDEDKGKNYYKVWFEEES